MKAWTHTYDRIEVMRKKSGKCPVCGRYAQRSHTFGGTVNPFNKNPDGTIRTPDEVLEQVKRKAEAWIPDFTHEACKP